jgi:hypothetical protein
MEQAHLFVFNACYYFFPSSGRTRDIANVTMGCYNMATGTEGHKVNIVAENKSRNAACSVGEGSLVMKYVTDGGLIRIGASRRRTGLVG